MYSFLENWYLAVLQRGEAWLAKRGLAKADIVTVGRRDFRGILAKGIGICDTAAIALVDYLQERGIPAGILALGGHVVAFASAGGRNYIIDPDFGVVVRDVPSPPVRSMDKITAAYRETGRSPKKLLQLEKIYAASPMKLYELDRFQSRWRRLLIRAEIIKWLVPMVLIALGIFFLFLRSSRGHPRVLPRGPAGT